MSRMNGLSRGEVVMVGTGVPVKRRRSMERARRKAMSEVRMRHCFLGVLNQEQPKYIPKDQRKEPEPFVPWTAKQLFSQLKSLYA